MNTPDDDLLDELLDDDAFDPKKLFDENEYSTLIIDREGFNKKQNNTADFLEGLLEPNVTRAESEEIFAKLKESNAQKLMVDAIKSAQREEEKIILTAACWECGLDFSADFIFFTELACSDNFKLAMEALTVGESCEGPFEEAVLKTALEISVHSKSKNEALVNDLTENIKSRIN